MIVSHHTSSSILYLTDITSTATSTSSSSSSSSSPTMHMSVILLKNNMMISIIKWLFTTIFAISIIILLIVSIQLCRETICIVNCNEGTRTTSTTTITSTITSIITTATTITTTTTTSSTSHITATSTTITMIGSNDENNAQRNYSQWNYSTSNGISTDRSKVVAKARDLNDDDVSKHVSRRMSMRMVRVIMMMMMKVMMVLCIALLFFAIRMGTFRLIFEGE